jgi:hypothetical protein
MERVIITVNSILLRASMMAYGIIVPESGIAYNLIYILGYIYCILLYIVPVIIYGLHFRTCRYQPAQCLSYRCLLPCRFYPCADTIILLVESSIPG